MKKYSKIGITSLITITTIMSISGCGPKVNIAEYKKVAINKAAIMPSANELAHLKPKVVVLALRNGSNDMLKKVDAGKTVADTTENMLVAAKIAEVVDRGAAQKLSEELALAEMKGESEKIYHGPNVADVAISGSLNSALVAAKYTEASTFCDKKGKCYTTPASCTYSGSISGTLKIYELPNIKISDSFPISNSKSFSEEGGCKSHYDKEGLISDVASGLSESAKVSLLNFFSPKGYVTERRENGGKSIFLVQLGALDGAAYNLKIKIYSMQTNTNPLTGNTTTEEILVGEGKISDQITPNTSWILIEDKAIADRIQLGDYVKFNYQKGLGDLFI